MSMITFEGNLTEQPELRFVGSNNTPVVNFSVAEDRRWTDQATGEVHKEVSFHRCAIWRDMATNFANSFRKGDRVLVVGRQNERSWSDAETQERRSRMEVTVENVGASTRFATVAITKTAGRGVTTPPAEAPEEVAAAASPI